jgi:hypothetical protein
MTVRAVIACLVVVMLASCAPKAVSPGAVTVYAGGSATYQTVLGHPARVDIHITDFSRDVPHLVLTFVGPNNWLLDHQSVATDEYAPCPVMNRELTCEPVVKGEYMNASMSGLTTKVGRFQYTLALWSEQNGHRQAINGGDGQPLTLNWTEGVSAP